MKTEDIFTFFQTMNADVQFCIKRINEGEDLEFWSRMYVRALASYVEGVAYMFRMLVKGLWRNGELQLSTEQQLFFLNLDWRVSDGEIQTTEKKLPTKEALKCLFVQLGAVGRGYKPDFSEGWSGMLAFYKARDALVHPKSLDALRISKSDLLKFEDARMWLEKETLTAGRALGSEGSASQFEIDG